MSEIVLENLTPHAVHLVESDGAVTVVLPATQRVAGVTTRSAMVERTAIAGWSGAIWRTELAAVESLPPQQPGTKLVVERIVAGAAAALGLPHQDLRFTLHLERDSDGRVVGCRRFGTM